MDLRRVNLTNSNQTLLVESLGTSDEGRYECKAANEGGAASAHQWVKLEETHQQYSVYGTSIAVPVFIAVGVALVLAIILVAAAKICLTTGRWKAPPTPPTPRLTQFDLPDDEEAESARLTLSRDGSPLGPPVGGPVCHGCQGCSGSCHQCAGCHYNMNGIYGCQGMGSVAGMPGLGGGGSIVGVRPAAHSPMPCHPMPPGPGSTCMSDYGSHTLARTQMNGTLRRELTMRQREMERRSASPRLSAEF